MKFIIKTVKSLGLLGIIRLMFSLALSKVYFPSARIVRFPFYIRKSNIAPWLKAVIKKKNQFLQNLL